MIKGKIEMVFEEEGANISANIELTGGIASKCFAIDSLCSALHLEGVDKTNALMTLALMEKIKED